MTSTAQTEQVLSVRGRSVTVSDLPPPPTLRSVGARMGWRGVTDAVVPLGLFLGLDSTLGLAPAMIGASAWSLAMIGLHRRGGRHVGALLWLSCAFIVARGAAGALTGSKYVYFGPAVVNDVALGVIFLASAALRRPAVDVVARFIYPFAEPVREHPLYRKVMTRLTLAWAGYLVTSAGVQAWLLATASANTLVWGRAVVSWPIVVALFAFSLRYPRRVFARDSELGPVVAAVEAKAGRGRRD